MVTAQRTSVDVLRRELKFRFQEELENEVQVNDVLEELVLDPVGESVSFPLFYQQYLSHAKSKKKDVIETAFLAGWRVPSRSEGAALPFILPYPNDSLHDCLNPPHTSRGVTKHGESETEFMTICPAPSDQPARRLILGGYDGGAEAGYLGEWTPAKFKNLIQTLETAKVSADNGEIDEKYVELGNRTFAVMPLGARIGGVTYKYVLEGMGMKIYIHSNPKGPIQAIRLRYGFEAFAGRDAFSVHLNTLEWFKEIGFSVTKETLSRADLQVMTFRPIEDYTMPFFGNRAVKKAQNSHFFTKGNAITSFTIGSKIQLCIYDKREELIKTCDEVKMSLIVNDCLGGELPDHLTRLEFRLRRDALKYFGINTFQDLLEKEHALVDFLTFDWFRLVKDEKQKGHTAEQELDTIWQEVRDLFFEYFPGPVENRKDIDRNTPGRREIKCTGDSLIKQAVGCLATAAALAKGAFETECQALSFVTEVVTEKVAKFVNRVRERVIDLGIVRGVEPPDAIDWHLEPRYACESLGDVMPYEFRVLFDEDLQYDRFSKVAVAGCPF